jgi:hypothetical protein
MPEWFKHKAKSILLLEWRFVPDKEGETGQARYWWSDGSRTEENADSYIDAVARLKINQDNRSVKGA